MTTETISILDPRARRPDLSEKTTFAVDGPLTGKVVGLRIDRNWQSYIAIVEEWEQRLRQDGAIPEVLWVSMNRVVGSEGEKNRTDLDEWSRLVDIGVVGLGN